MFNSKYLCIWPRIGTRFFFLQIFEIIDSNYIGIDESSFKYVFEVRFLKVRYSHENYSYSYSTYFEVQLKVRKARAKYVQNMLYLKME